MLNEMCKNCWNCGTRCQGTENQVWTGCVYRKEKPRLVLDGFSKHLLTTTKRFLYVGMNDRAKPIKRNKALSKFFREEINDFIYVTETETTIFFSDASSWFANTCMED